MSLGTFEVVPSDGIDEFVRLDHQLIGKKKSDIEKLAEELLEGVRTMPEDQFNDPISRLLFGTSALTLFNMVYARKTLDNGRLVCSFAVSTAKQTAWICRVDRGRAHLWYSEAIRGHKIFNSFEEMGPAYKKDCCKWLKIALRPVENIKSSLLNKEDE